MLLICAYHCLLVPLLVWHSFPGEYKPSLCYLFFETFLDCPHLFVKNCQAHVECLVPIGHACYAMGNVDASTIGKYTDSKQTHEYPSQEREQLCCVVLCPLCSFPGFLPCWCKLARILASYRLSHTVGTPVHHLPQGAFMAYVPVFHPSSVVGLLCTAVEIQFVHLLDICCIVSIFLALTILSH